MARPYSNDLRERAATLVSTGRSCREVASLFGVSVASVVKWSQRQRATGTAAARPMGGHRKRLLEPHRDLVIARLKAMPDLTIKALVAELAEHGITTSPVSVWRLVRSAGLRFKKTLFAIEQERPTVARRRTQWKNIRGRLDPRRLVFVDETWAKTNMTPIRGWAPRGSKLVARAPFGKWRTLTFLAALRHDRIDAPCVLDGPINGQSFTAWVEQFLVPTLAPGDIVIMDNLGSHKGQAVRHAIRAAGAKLLFLPPPACAGAGCTAPISIQSSRSSPSSSSCCARPPSDPPTQPGAASAIFSTPSRPTNAPTTCEVQAMLQAK